MDPIGKGKAFSSDTFSVRCWNKQKVFDVNKFCYESLCFSEVTFSKSSYSPVHWTLQNPLPWMIVFCALEWPWQKSPWDTVSGFYPVLPNYTECWKIMHWELKSSLLRISAPVNINRTADNPTQSNTTIVQKASSKQSKRFISKQLSWLDETRLCVMASFCKVVA